MNTLLLLLFSGYSSALMYKVLCLDRHAGRRLQLNAFALFMLEKRCGTPLQSLAYIETVFILKLQGVILYA